VCEPPVRGNTEPVEMRMQETVLARRYRLGERIAFGAMSEVYDGVDLRLDRRVAVKLLRPHLVDRPDMRRRVEAEGRLAARIRHPNVVAVYDAGVVDGHPFVVMERLPGPSLQDALGGGPLPEAAVRRLARDVLLGLEAAHGLGVVHRDVKPGNVLADGAGGWKVADFGIATWLGDDGSITATGEVVGSAAYLAPERLAGAPATLASDVYAVGLVLAEALTGQRPAGWAAPGTPRAGPSLGEVRPDVDPALLDAIERATDPDPAARWATAAAFRSAVASGDGGTDDGWPGAEETLPIPGPEETLPIARPEATAVLPVVPEGGVSSAEPAPPEPPDPSARSGGRPVVAPARTRRSDAVRWLSAHALVLLPAAAALAIAFAIVVAFAVAGPGEGATPADRPAAAGGRAALEVSLDRLEEAIRP
jgi:serine/threonine protein kinase